MTDYLVRATGAGGTIRAIVATTTGLVAEAQRRHDLSPLATAALGRALTGAALLGATGKDKQTVTLRFDVGGPIGGVTAEATAEGHARGFVKQPHVDLPLSRHGKFDVAGALGPGFLHVIKDIGVREYYTGTSEIVSGEIAEDLAYYLTTSEQVPSAVGLGVLMNEAGVVAAGGYLLQTLPAASSADVDRLEANLKLLGAVSARVSEGQSPEEMLATLLAGMEYEILATQPLSFHCRCSRERAAEILASIHQRDLRDLHDEDEGAELTCQFCAATYRFTKDELAAMLTADATEALPNS
jgi:molecular chaperone Hsp33